jgi:hypothetical protein
MARVVGWLLVPIGWIVFALGAFLAWSTWDAVAWGVDSFSPLAAAAAGLGTVATVVGLGALLGRPRFLCLATAAIGLMAAAFATDLIARGAGGSLFGDLDGWQGSDAGGISSLAPAWAVLVEGMVLVGVGVALGARRRTDGGARDIVPS